mmetsp:Transcript_2142/g.5043  ORF Transcript_2142/g.5043 Transcript_2142/m.5043 type:complete len:399 (+) Transcript_2142:175-1371(+)
MNLLVSLVDFLEQQFKDISWHDRHLVQFRLNGLIGFLFVFLKDRFKIQFIVHLLDLGNLGIVPSAVIVSQGLALLVVGPLEGLHDEPGALGILDIRTDFANHGRIAVAIQNVIGDLKVLSHDAANIASRLVGLGIGNLRCDHAHGNGQIETVKGRLVLDDFLISLQSEASQIDGRCRRSGRIEHGGVNGLRREIQELSKFGILNDIQEQFDQEVIIWLLSKVLLEQSKDEILQNETIVDRDKLDLGYLVPAGLSSSGLTLVHDIVRHEKEGLQEFDGPSQNAGLGNLLVGEAPALEGPHDAHHGRTAIQFATGNVVIHHVLDPLNGLIGHLLAFHNLENLIAKHREQTFEFLLDVFRVEFCHFFQWINNRLIHCGSQDMIHFSHYGTGCCCWFVCHEV